MIHMLGGCGASFVTLVFGRPCWAVRSLSCFVFYCNPYDKLSTLLLCMPASVPCPYRTLHSPSQLLLHHRPMSYKICCHQVTLSAGCSNDQDCEPPLKEAMPEWQTPSLPSAVSRSVSSAATSVTAHPDTDELVVGTGDGMLLLLASDGHSQERATVSTASRHQCR